MKINKTNKIIKPLLIKPEIETKKIIKFIQAVFKTQAFDKAVIGVSGGVDSTLSLLLLTQALGVKKVIPVQLPYGQQSTQLSSLAISTAGISKRRIKRFNIKPIVDQIVKTINCKYLAKSKIRLGNIMVRTRMILLYDLAKKHNALVCGTENKSEYLLGYFTRYGDEASDLEPIRHLYKTQVYQLAEYLGVPEQIIQTPPSAGLWPGQNDEKQFGFSYQKGDQVLYLYIEKNLSLTEIVKKTELNKSVVEKVINWYQTNYFKHEVPYRLE